MENLQTQSAAAATTASHKKTRYFILAMIFIITSLNYGDRATLSMAASPMTQELGIDSVTMGYIFSAFAWAYVIGDWTNSRWLVTR